MDVKINEATLVQAQQQQQRQPLLENAPSSEAQKPAKTPAQKAIRKTFKGTTQLSKLLPTGSVLAFQFFSPVLTNQGKCITSANQLLTVGLLAICGLSCFFLCFTDSYRDEKGKVRYGFATFKGLLVLDGSIKFAPEEAEKYKIRFLDFVHAFMSVLVFGAVALFDKNVVKCLCPTPTEEMKELLIKIPIGVGIACSIFFLVFPTRRNGIGSPLSRD